MMEQVPDLGYLYSPSQWSHRMGPDEVINEHVNVLTTNSHKAVTSLDSESISYGSSPEQKVVMFGLKSLPLDSPILVYIHGGYWQFLSCDQSYFLAPSFCNTQVVVAAIGYDLAPKVTLRQIVSQVEQGLQVILDTAAQRNSRGVYICGHSAGGHLTLMMALSSCKNKHLLKGLIPVSAIYDVRPIVFTYINDPLHLTVEEAWQLSPLYHIDNIVKTCQESNLKLLLVVAEHDPPPFHQQAQEFNQAAERQGLESKLLTVEHMDHFDVIEQLSCSEYILTKEILQLMGAVDDHQ